MSKYMNSMTKHQHVAENKEIARNTPQKKHRILKLISS